MIAPLTGPNRTANRTKKKKEKNKLQISEGFAPAAGPLLAWWLAGLLAYGLLASESIAVAYHGISFWDASDHCWPAPGRSPDAEDR